MKTDEWSRESDEADPDIGLGPRPRRLEHPTVLEVTFAKQVARSFEVFGDALGVGLRDYMEGTDELPGIPPLPRWAGNDAHRSNLLLVDGRVEERLGLAEMCRLAGIAFHHREEDIIPRDPRNVRHGARWICFESGSADPFRRIVDWRDGLPPRKVAEVHAEEGIAWFVKNHTSVFDAHTCLTGSIHRLNTGLVCCLGIWGNCPELGLAPIDCHLRDHRIARRRVF